MKHKMLSPANDQNIDMRLCCIHMTMISAQEYYIIRHYHQNLSSDFESSQYSFQVWYLFLRMYILNMLNRGVARLSTSGGQERNISSFSYYFLPFFLNFSSFSSSIWCSGWTARPPGKALATPLILKILALVILKQNVIKFI